ncbi:MAG: cytochrome c biogenesis protein CcsA [SAR324 cluster bacterium]|nr:cytochrome c biogenesis protein CcsA [SAR324 cluster bacterium]
MMRWTKILEPISIISLLGCGIWIFMGTPIETEMGFSQKIMYLHVPTVIVTYLAFFVVFAFSIAYLWKRDMMFDQVAKSSAEVGLIFCGLVLVTGAIWGKPTWGTYWVWDARLTTTLLLFLIFAGYFLLRAFATDREREARLASVLGIIGFLDIPIIHKSVEWWRTLHQPTTLLKVNEAGEAKPAMPMDLLLPLLVTMLAMLLFYGYLLFLRIQMEERYHVLQETIVKKEGA